MLPSGPFEFGPLLAGRVPPVLMVAAAGPASPGSMPAPTAPPECHADHVARFKLANCGRFPVHADFWLKSEGEAADPAHGASDAARAAKKGATPAAAGGSSGSASARGPGPKGAAAAPLAVQLWPRSLHLGVGEAGELRVMAFPQVEGAVQDVVMCRCGAGSVWEAWDACLPGAACQMEQRARGAMHHALPPGGRNPGSRCHSFPGPSPAIAKAAQQPGTTGIPHQLCGLQAGCADCAAAGHLHCGCTWCPATGRRRGCSNGWHRR